MIAGIRRFEGTALLPAPYQGVGAGGEGVLASGSQRGGEGRGEVSSTNDELKTNILVVLCQLP